MLLVILELILVITTVILFVIKGVSILTIGLVIGIILIAMLGYIHHKSRIKKYNAQSIQKFRNRLDQQVRETLVKRAATELQKADAISKNNCELLSETKKNEKIPKFNLNTSIINGGEMLVELRLATSRYNNESKKDRKRKYII